MIVRHRHVPTRQSATRANGECHVAFSDNHSRACLEIGRNDGERDAQVFKAIDWKASAHDKVLQTVGAILRSVREIGIQDVAGKVGKTPAETEVLISESIAAGYVQGYVDPREGKFVATAWGAFAPGQMPQIVIQAPATPQAAYPPSYAPSAAAPPSGTPESRFCRDCGSRIEKIPGQTYWQCPHCGNIQ